MQYRKLPAATVEVSGRCTDAETIAAIEAVNARYPGPSAGL